jgi:exodeoxyribonuclease-3
VVPEAAERRYAALVRLVTWNVNSLTARLPRVEQLIGELRPDVLCLQETRVRSEAFPAAALGALGYSTMEHSAGSWAGVALAVGPGLELTDPVRGLPGEPDAAEARWVEAEVAGIRFASVYVPNGRVVGSETFVAKLAFLDAMRARVAAGAGTPLVVAGDLNVTRSDLDLYDPVAFVGDTHVTPEERSRLEAVLGAGMVDTWREQQPEAPGYTWWDYRAGNFHKGLGMRIDYALLTPDLAKQVSRIAVERNFRKGQKPSDHAPLVVDLEG